MASLAALLAGSASPPDAEAQTTRVSVASDGSQGNGNSLDAALSADGRFVAFESDASNLAPGDTNERADVFVHDRVTRQTTRVSVAADGTQGNFESYHPAMSADGRVVAFFSFASNLVPGDTNGWADVFVHDRVTGQTTRVSVASDGTQWNANSYWPAVSADGRFVAFHSAVRGIREFFYVYVHDRLTGQTTLVSVASDGTPANGRSSRVGALSADGRLVAFNSDANNLVPGDTNLSDDVFVHDRVTNQTTRVSVASDGTQGNSLSFWAALSADGRFIAFESFADNLVPGDTNRSEDIFAHDRVTRQTTRVSVASDGTQANDSTWEQVDISSDGRVVAFSSSASNLVVDDTNGFVDVFVRVLGTDTVPGAPSSLTASVSGATVTLTWIAPTTGGAPTTYVLEAGSSPGGSNLANFETGSTATSYTAPDVPSGTYYVRARARNSAGTSPPSNEVTALVGSCVSPPSPPSGLGFVVSGRIVTLAWNPAAGGPTSYVIEAGSAPGASNIANFDTGNTATTFTAIDVPSGTYYVRVRARNPCGTSGSSNEVTVRVP